MPEEDIRLWRLTFLDRERATRRAAHGKEALNDLKLALGVFVCHDLYRLNHR